MREDFSTYADEALLARAVTEPSVFEALVDRYQDAFRRKARTFLNSDEDAEDAVQETFVKIYTAAPRFRKTPGASFKSWGYMILMNTCISLYRKRKRRAVSELRIDPEWEEILADNSATAAAEQYTLSEQVLSFVGNLPEVLRRTLTLHALDGYSYQEIAEAEDVTLSVVKSRIHRAKEKLRAMTNKL